MMLGNMGFMDLWQQYWTRLHLGQYCYLRSIKLHIALIIGPYLYNMIKHGLWASKENKNDKTLDLRSFRFCLNLIRIQVRLKRSFERAITHYDVIVVVVIPQLFTNVVCMMAMLLSCVCKQKAGYQMYVRYMVGLLMWTVGTHGCFKNNSFGLYVVFRL